ncbi:MAG: response regulator transcription factor [Chloroflexota bacterium]|nr:response regulator transcription factor [Chloroflexota bacterium]
MYKLFIVEDHPVMRAAYAKLINRETDLEVVGVAETGQRAMEMIPSAQPDLVLVDISLPGMSGIALVTHLRTQQPALLTLIISGHEEALYAKHALQAGARGYLVKSGLADVMIPAIRQVLAGELYISDSVRQKLRL